MKMNSYKIINIYETIYMYNNMTGLFFEIDNDTCELLKESISFIKKNCHGLYECLKENHFIADGRLSEELRNAYPIVSPNAVWNKKHISYTILNNTIVDEIDNFDLEVFELCDGTKSINDILKYKKTLTYVELTDRLLKWTQYRKQVIKIFDTPYSKDNKIFFKVFMNPSIKHKINETINESEYYEDVKCADIQFEDIETTISYLLRQDTGILKYKTYGYQFCKKIIGCKYQCIDDISILEVGGGIGDFAKSFNHCLVDNHVKYTYDICDLSSELIRSQKVKCKDFIKSMSFINMNANNINSLNKVYDVIISNEVISDFWNIKLDSNNDQCSNTIKKYNIKTLVTNDQYLNIGAIAFIEDIYDILSHNGSAYIVEYTEIDGSSCISNCMPDHIEVSINFKVLECVAKQVGFKTKMINLVDFLDIDNSTYVLSQMSFTNLREIVKEQGKRLDKLLYKREYIEMEFSEFRNLKYINIANIMGFFNVLVLEKEIRDDY